MNQAILAIDAQANTLDDFARFVLGVMDRPVVNRTGIEGRFDIHLEFAPDDNMPMPGAAVPDPLAPSIFTALQEQLGLKLESAKGPREFLVIDSVQRPSDN